MLREQDFSVARSRAGSDDAHLEALVCMNFDALSWDIE
jgi:hypothetical protein